MMPGRRPTAPVKLWASASNTFTASGSASLTPSLGAGQVGKPVVIRASGSVSGDVTLTFGNNSQVVVLVNPNAPYTEETIPPSAFNVPSNSVSVTANADGAGTIRVAVGFA